MAGRQAHSGEEREGLVERSGEIRWDLIGTPSRDVSQIEIRNRLLLLAGAAVGCLRLLLLLRLLTFTPTFAILLVMMLSFMQALHATAFSHVPGLSLLMAATLPREIPPR